MQWIINLLKISFLKASLYCNVWVINHCFLWWVKHFRLLCSQKAFSNGSHFNFFRKICGALKNETLIENVYPFLTLDINHKINIAKIKVIAWLLFSLWIHNICMCVYRVCACVFHLQFKRQLVPIRFGVNLKDCCRLPRVLILNIQMLCWDMLAY